MKNKALRIVVYGVVQGVFYRKNTLEKAQSLGILGWVRNESDGSVSIHAQGDAREVDELAKWCYRGSPRSRVDRVVLIPTELLELDRFYIDRN